MGDYPKERYCARLKHGMTADEVGAILGMSREAVESTLSRAMRKMRKRARALKCYR